MTRAQLAALKRAEEWAEGQTQPGRMVAPRPKVEPGPSVQKVSQIEPPDPEANPDCRPDFLGARCTLDGLPAKIIGRSHEMAYIERVDGQGEPCRMTWDAVADVMDNCDCAFCFEADNDEEPSNTQLAELYP